MVVATFGIWEEFAVCVIIRQALYVLSPVAELSLTEPKVELLNNNNPEVF